MGPTHTHTILTVTTNPETRTIINHALQQEGHDIIEALDSQAALRLARECRPDVIIVSDINGIELCGHLRSMPLVNKTPILLVSQHQSAQYAAHALDNGADDFLRKPFAARELKARVRALLRHTFAIHLNGRPMLRLDDEAYTVWVDRRAVSLTPTEFLLLHHLCQKRDEQLTAHKLLEIVWNYPPGGGDTALVRNHIRNLRRKIEKNPNQPAIIVSQHGRGYSVDAHILN